MTLPERDIRPRPEVSAPRHRHRVLIVFMAFMLLATAAYGGWWYMLAQQTRTHLDAWFADARLSGHQASYEDVRITGFPSQIILDIQNVHLAHANGQWEVDIPAVKAQATPWQLNRINGSVANLIGLKYRGGNGVEVYTLSSRASDFVVSLKNQGAIEVSMVEAGLSGPRLVKPITVEQISASLRRREAPTFISVALNITDAALAVAGMSPFGDKVEDFKAIVDVIGAPARAGELSDRLDNWRRDGGTIEVRRLNVRHGVLGLDGDGTIALDENLQPIGAFNALISGFNPAVDALVDLGVVKDQEGRLIKAALGLFAKSPSGGGPKQIEVPLTVQNRQLSIGPFPLFRVPAIRWD